ncbi:MAG: 50S ribosomal protein L31 [Solirubrobacteraceae bacterium]
MKRAIHPEMHEINAQCVCGNSLLTRSTLNDIHTTICSACHPYFTGEQKLLDTEGRIKKFEKRFKKGIKRA